MQDSLNSDDPTLIKSSAHKIKGAAANVRANKLSESAKVIEILAADNDLENIQDKMAVLEDCWSKTFKAIQSHIKAIDNQQ